MSTPTETRASAVDRLVAAAVAQGHDEHVTDPAALARVAAIITAGGDAS